MATIEENLRLFASRRFANQPGFWFYFRILAAGLLPWTGLLVGRLIDDVRAAWDGERLDTLELVLWAWTAVSVGFFTLSTFRLDHYIFPAAPALRSRSASSSRMRRRTGAPTQGNAALGVAAPRR